jgi:hypothetical protein
MSWESQPEPRDDSRWSQAIADLRSATADIVRGLERLQSVLHSVAGSQAEPPRGVWAEPEAQPTRSAEPQPEATAKAHEEVQVSPAGDTSWAALAQELQALENEQPAAEEATEVEQASGWSVSMQAAFEDKLTEQTTTWGQKRPEEDEEFVRDEVRRLVEQARSEMASSHRDFLRSGTQEEETSAPVAGQPAADQEGSWPRPSQPAPARDWAAEASAPRPEPPPAPTAEGDPARDEVRRAVEQARAELAGADRSNVERATPPPARPAEQTIDEKIAGLAPQIMIEDPAGRVELVRVYQALARLGRASDANLTNYTPHSVTVTLESGVVPSNADLGAAVEDAFGRPCQVAHDASGRIVVRLVERNSWVA